MKTVLLNTFFIIFLVTLFACKKNTEGNTVNGIKQKVTGQINWIGHWKGEGKRQKYNEEIANEFEFRNQEIKINLSYADEVYYDKNGDFTQNNRLEDEFDAKQLIDENPKWDIVRLKDNYSGIAKILNDNDWGRKYLVDFSEFPDFVAAHDPIVFTPEYKLQTGGITIGPYTEGFNFALWYNKKLAEKIGINFKQFGMTPEEFLAGIKAVNEYNKTHQTNIIPLYEESGWITSIYLAHSMFFSLVGDYNELISEEYKPQKLEYLRQVLEYFEQLSTYNPTPADRSKISWTQTYDWPLNEKCLFYFQGSWMYNIWEGIDKKKVRDMIPVELPSYNGKSPAYIGGYKACFGVLKRSPNKENAIKFLKFWASTQNAEKWVRYTKSPTGLKGNVATSYLGFDQFDDFQYTISKKYGNNLLSPNDNRLYFGLKNKDVNFALIDVLEKRKTAKETMAEIKRQIKP